MEKVTDEEMAQMLDVVGKVAPLVRMTPRDVFAAFIMAGMATRRETLSADAVEACFIAANLAEARRKKG